MAAERRQPRGLKHPQGSSWSRLAIFPELRVGLVGQHAPSRSLASQQLMTQSIEPSSFVCTIGHSLVWERVPRPGDCPLAYELAAVEAACCFRKFITSRVISRQACHST